MKRKERALHLSTVVNRFSFNFHQPRKSRGFLLPKGFELKTPTVIGNGRFFNMYDNRSTISQSAV